MTKWPTIETKNILQGGIFRYFQVKRKSPKTSEVGTFDIIQCANWVNVIAITPEKKIILIKQYRHGTDECTIEIPGGAINRGEDPLVGAQRELEEETGFTSSEWVLLGKVDVNPAFMTNTCEVFLALNAQQTAKQNLDPFEEIDVFFEDVKNINQLIKNRKITHSLVIAAIYFFLQVPDWE
jgi:8-oxo-dGTP pyrophosphatase MutT (NUDIX family)